MPPRSSTDCRNGRQAGQHCSPRALGGLAESGLLHSVANRASESSAGSNPAPTAMPTIKANCESCGDVTVTEMDMVVRMCSDNDQHSYAFLCPECQTRTARLAPLRISDLLIDAGVRVQVWHLPKELTEPHPVAPPFTEDDLLDFHVLLQEDDWFDQLLTTPRDL